MSLKFLANQEILEVSKINQNLLFVFTCKADSKFLEAQSKHLETQRANLENVDAKVLFLTTEESSTNNPDLVLDIDGELIGLSENLNVKNPGENLIVLRKNGNTFEHLETKTGPESSSDWVIGLVDFANNYKDSEPDGDYYKWGQIVPESGEYLCKDCGYILELEAGKIFPICEVCLAGESSGPSGPKEGYWERV
jgi:rubrerythrin